MSTKNFFKEVSYYSLPPVSIAGIAALTFVITNNMVATLIALTSSWFLSIFLILRKGQESYTNDYCKLQILSLLIADVFIAIVFFYILYIRNTSTNPLGQIGWTITISLSSLSIFFCILINKNDLGYRGFVNRFISRILQVLNLLVLIAVTYLFFGRQIIWLPLIFCTILAWLVVSREESWDNWYSTESIPIIATIISIFIGSISTIVQFWFANIAFGYYFGEIFITSVALIILGISIYKIVKYFKLKRLKKKLDLKKSKEIEVEKIYQQEIRSQKTAASKEENDRRIKEATQLYETLMKKEVITWQDLDFVLDTIDGLKNNLPYDLMVKAKLIDLIQVSEVKKQIAWNGNTLTNAIWWINKSCQLCFDDNVLQNLLNQVKDLEKYKDYQGYNHLFGIVKDPSNSTLKRLLTTNQSEVN